MSVSGLKTDKRWNMQGNQVIKFSSCVLLLLLVSGPFAEASVSLGFKSAWSGIQRALKSEKNPYRSPHITIHYPSGAVKDYIWTTVRPFLWSYVCRYCTYLPERCDGDLAYCKINLRKVRYPCFVTLLFKIKNSIYIFISILISSTKPNIS